MKIIDKNKDLYDYLQDVYRDPRIIFDRTDSFVLTKEIIVSNINYKSWYYSNDLDNIRYLLLQICNTFWLFELEITKFRDNGDAEDFSPKLLAKWKNYNKPRCLISLNLIRLDWDIHRFLSRHKDTDSMLDRITASIDNNSFEKIFSFNRERVSIAGNQFVYKHIPLLKASGLSSLIDPLDAYLSFEEFFSLEKTASERDSSIGITDRERLENHGFDNRISFRGKNN